MILSHDRADRRVLPPFARGKNTSKAAKKNSHRGEIYVEKKYMLSDATGNCVWGKIRRRGTYTKRDKGKYTVLRGKTHLVKQGNIHTEGKHTLSDANENSAQEEIR